MWFMVPLPRLLTQVCGFEPHHGLSLPSKSSTLATVSIFSMQYSLEYVMDGEDFYILMAVRGNIIIGKM